MNVVVHIRELVVEGGGPFPAEQFQARLAEALAGLPEAASEDTVIPLLVVQTADTPRGTAEATARAVRSHLTRGPR